MSADFNEALRLSFILHDVARLRRVAVDRMLKPLGVTRAQWSVLTFLLQRDGMTQTALAADLDMTKVSVGALLGRMEAAELIYRRSDETDARIRRVYLARGGNRLVGEIRKQMEGFENDLLQGVTDDEFAAVSRTLESLKASLVPVVYGERTDPGTARRNIAFSQLTADEGGVERLPADAQPQQQTASKARGRRKRGEA